MNKFEERFNMKKHMFFILGLILLLTGCNQFQRDVEIADEVLQAEEKIVDEYKNRK